MIDYETEADLCRAFIANAEAAGWTAYPETSGWDIILERRGFLVDTLLLTPDEFEVAVRHLVAIVEGNA